MEFLWNLSLCVWVFALTLSCIMLKNGQTYFKDLVVFAKQYFESKFSHFSALCVISIFRQLFQKKLWRTAFAETFRQKLDQNLVDFAKESFFKILLCGKLQEEMK